VTIRAVALAKNSLNKNTKHFSAKLRVIKQ